MSPSKPSEGGSWKAPSAGYRKRDGFSIIGIGASAGGLDACKALIAALPTVTGMAFILIQHLDPMHESMMVDLLADHTKLIVEQATDGMPVEIEHLYVIPPGVFLSIAGGILHVSRPEQRHGARLPFDFFLASLAEDSDLRAVCIVLSGTGADGSQGAKAISAAGGLVLVQDPAEAKYDGMPRSAIASGVVDQVLPVARMPDALSSGNNGTSRTARARGGGQPDRQADLKQMLALLRAGTPHDFTTYKTGTLQRRIERRMVIANIAPRDTGRYLKVLRETPLELELLAKDLLIHVTSFFRDKEVFDLLERETIPSLLKGSADGSIRIWIAGCSTGEETYSLAILLREAILAGKLDVKVQIFASDVDPGAVSTAREGLYDATIANEISQDRLSRFFTKEDGRYRVSPDLRSAVVFTVQDVLVDPPFARVDMISCRNLLIYLNLDAQLKVMSLFHFALKDGGVLLLGSAETVGRAKHRFEVVAKAARVYRKVGRSRSADLDFVMSDREGFRETKVSRTEKISSPQSTLADVCRRSVLETYAPAAVLINSSNECVFHLGPTNAYLRVPSGVASHNVLDMVSQRVRTKLRTAIEGTRRTGFRTVAVGKKAVREDGGGTFDIAVQPASGAEAELLLVCFIDAKSDGALAERPIPQEDVSRVIELERELEATKAELNGAIRDLERSGEDQKAVNEEALSFNEEYQSTNEELVTSKEELQSFNEELAALNGQLQETLEKQRTAAHDLENVLYSTDVATLFLDGDLRIRFFTPATRALFKVIPGDVGRPLGDLHSIVPDEQLPSDIQMVLTQRKPVEREIKAKDGTWFIRRVMPYRGHDDLAGGVVITFTDITDRKRDAVALEAAKRQAELATLAKSRFLAAASHDLRQPLQTLALIHGLLAKSLDGSNADKLIAGLEDTLGAMSGMLNTLLDVNQIEAGTVNPEVVCFPIIDLLDRMREEFSYVAKAQRLELTVVSCRLSVKSDPRLLEQMIRNLLSNALKYTDEGRVLVGCRRHGDMLRIEIWDTGAGIPDKDLKSIFEEYHQLDNDARERSRGLGLGLSIVRSLGTLLGHHISVESRPGKGSVFAVEVALNLDGAAGGEASHRTDRAGATDASLPLKVGELLVIEDDPEIRELLSLLLKKNGHRTKCAADGNEALALISDTMRAPDVIIADYNLPNGLNGLQAAAQIQERLRRKIPVIILTGDISTDALRAIADGDCRQLNKPVQATDLTGAIQSLLRSLPEPVAVAVERRRTLSAEPEPVVFIVDDDDGIRMAIRVLFEAEGRIVEDFADCESFLDSYEPGREACLLIDACLPGMSGLDLLRRLRIAGHPLPTIMITGQSDVPMAVQAMKAGATDFIEKPFKGDEIVACVQRALDCSRDANKKLAWQEDASQHISSLTQRQHQIMDLVLAGHPSKNIASDLGISQRTVENHRASIMKRTGSKSLPALARLALAASSLIPAD